MRGRGRWCRVVAPRRGLQTGGDALGHELMISRMKLDEIAAKALGIEAFQLRWALVCLARELEHGGAAPLLAEGGERGRLALAAIARNGIPQRLVAAVEIDVHIGR